MIDEYDFIKVNGDDSIDSIHNVIKDNIAKLLHTLD